MSPVPDRELRLYVFYNGDEADAGMARTAAIADETSNKIGVSGTKGAQKFGSEMEKGTSRAGSAFSKLGQSASNWGLPFSNTLSKIGTELSTTGTKAQGFGHAMSLAGGITVAAMVGVGVEAVKMADKFDIAQAGLKTAVKNSGGVWSEYSGQVAAAAKTTGALVTGNATDVDSALTILTTATGNTGKALKDLNLVENISALRHISLADSASLVAKLYAGSTRVLTQFGINLDIGSGKLHSVQSAMEAVQKDTLALTIAQKEVSTGQETGARASGMLATAELNLRNAHLQLKQSQDAISESLGALNIKTQGAATAVGKTLGGEIDIAKHSIDNMGISLGTILIPKLDTLVGDGAKVLGFFEQNKVAADALGIAVGVTLASAVAVFTYNTVASIVGGLVKMGTGFASLATTALTKMGVINTAAEEDAALQTQTSATAVAAQEAIQRAWATTATAIETMSETEFATFGQLDAAWSTLAADAAVASATADTAIAGMATADEAAGTAIIAENAAIDASFTAMLGPIAAVTAALGLGIVEWGKYEQAQNAAQVAGGTTVTGIESQAAQAIKSGAYGSLPGLIAQLQAKEGSGGEFRKASAGTLTPHGREPGMPASPAEIALEAYVAELRTKLASATPAQLAHTLAAATAATPTIPTSAAATSSGTGSVAIPGTIIPGSTIPALGPTPSVTGGAATASTALSQDTRLQTAALGQLGGLQTAAAGGTSRTAQGQTVQNLSAQLTPEHHRELEKLVTELNATHNQGMQNLATKLSTEWASAQAKLTTIIDSDTQAGQSKIATLQDAIGNASYKALLTDTNGIHKTQMEALVAELNSTHNAKLEKLATQITNTWDKAVSTLAAVVATRQQTAYADWLQKEAAKQQGETTAVTNASAAVVTDMKDKTQIVVDSFNAAAQRITMATTIVTDVSSSLVQGINDSVTAMNAASAAQVTAITAAATTQADILGERGQYGLKLVAQEELVHLDQVTARDDAREASATAHLDQVTAKDNQLVAAAKLHADQVTQTTTLQEQRLQATADRVALTGAVDVAKVQAHADQVNIGVAIHNAAAQAHVDAVQDLSPLAQRQAAAAEQMVEGQGALATATAQGLLANATNQANAANQNATGASNQYQANAAKQQAQANAALAAAQANANRQIALAERSLAAITDNGNKQQAVLKALYDVTSAMAAVQFAGSGLVVNQYGISASNAQANADELSWVLRTNRV